MRLKLKSDSYFTVGAGAHPVDLVSKASGDRIGLNEDEAAVAMLLMEGCPEGQPLASLVQKHGVAWDLPTLETYLSKLEAARLLLRRGRHQLVANTDDVEALDLLELQPGYDTDTDAFGDKTDADAVGDSVITNVADVPDVPDVIAVDDGETTVDLPPGLDELMGQGGPQETAPPTVESPIDVPQPSMPPAAAVAPQPAAAPEPKPPAEPVPALRTDLEARPLPDGTVALTDPHSGVEQRLAQDVLRLSYLFDGQRTPRQVVEAARAEGMNVTVQIVQTVAERLTARGLVGPSPAASGHSSAVSPMPGAGEVMPHVTGPMPAPDGGRTSGVYEPGIEATALATALVLMRDQRFAEAQAAVQPVLNRNPDSPQALTLLQLIQTEAARTQVSRRKRRIVRLAIFGGLGLCLLTALFVPVPHRLTVPCVVRTIAAGAVTAPISGKLERLVAKGQVVNKGQEVARISDEEAAKALPALRAKLADNQDLLRIMRTGGNDEDARKNRKTIGQLKDEIDDLDDAGCVDDACREQLKRLKARVAIAKRKLKYCEWKAFDDEVKAMTAKLERAEADIAKLRAKAKISITSSTTGLITHLHPTATVGKGAEIIRMVKSDRFQVEAAIDGDHPPVGTKVELTLARGAARQSYFAKISKLQPGKAQILIESEVNKVLLDGTCQAKLTAGRILLIKSLLR